MENPYAAASTRLSFKRFPSSWRGAPAASRGGYGRPVGEGLTWDKRKGGRRKSDQTHGKRTLHPPLELSSSRRHVRRAWASWRSSSIDRLLGGSVAQRDTEEAVKLGIVFILVAVIAILGAVTIKLTLSTLPT